MILVKIHQAYRYIVAVCDSDLIDKKFEDGNKQLDLTGNFFKGEEKTEEEVGEIILDMQLEDATFNIVGKKSCELAKKQGLISEGGIIHIGGVPIALVLM